MFEGLPKTWWALLGLWTVLFAIWAIAAADAVLI
jgi:hypothetical protein